MAGRERHGPRDAGRSKHSRDRVILADSAVAEFARTDAPAATGSAARVARRHVRRSEFSGFWPSARARLARYGNACRDVHADTGPRFIVGSEVQPIAVDAGWIGDHRGGILGSRSIAATKWEHR